MDESPFSGEAFAGNREDARHPRCLYYIREFFDGAGSRVMALWRDFGAEIS
jgi:hypothetical protein